MKQFLSSMSAGWKKRKVLGFGVFSVVLLLTGLSIYWDVRLQGTPVYRGIQDVPQMPVAIVFGAGVGTIVLADRVNTAIALYKSGKVRKILMTGDNGHADYDEPRSMRMQAVHSGVPVRDIVCDYAGFRTYDSLYRARNIFDVHNAILVTQDFHLPRAIFIAKHLGLSVIGVDASMHPYGVEKYWYEFRELIASQGAWLDVLTQRKPKFLGKKEPLFAGDEVSQAGDLFKIVR